MSLYHTLSAWLAPPVCKGCKHLKTCEDKKAAAMMLKFCVDFEEEQK